MQLNTGTTMGPVDKNFLRNVFQRCLIYFLHFNSSYTPIVAVNFLPIDFDVFILFFCEPCVNILTLNISS